MYNAQIPTTCAHSHTLTRAHRQAEARSTTKTYNLDYTCFLEIFLFHHQSNRRNLKDRHLLTRNISVSSSKQQKKSKRPTFTEYNYREFIVYAIQTLFAMGSIIYLNVVLFTLTKTFSYHILTKKMPIVSCSPIYLMKQTCKN